MIERRCRSCACTEADCSRCVERTGAPCTWAEEDLCSACVEESRLLIYRPADESPLSTVVLEAAGPVIYAVDGGQYLTDLGDSGDHLVEVLDGKASGLWFLTGRIAATLGEASGEKWINYAAEDGWAAARPKRETTLCFMLGRKGLT